MGGDPLEPVLATGSVDLKKKFKALLQRLVLASSWGLFSEIIFST